MEKDRKQWHEGVMDQGQGLRGAEIGKQPYEVPSDGLGKHKGKSGVRENNKWQIQITGAAAHGICGTPSNRLIDLANVEPRGHWVVRLRGTHCLLKWNWKALRGHANQRKCHILPVHELINRPKLVWFDKQGFIKPFLFCEDCWRRYICISGFLGRSKLFVLCTCNQFFFDRV